MDQGESEGDALNELVLLMAASMATIKRRGIRKKREKSRVATEAKRLSGRKKFSPKRRNKTSKKAKNGDGS